MRPQLSLPVVRQAGLSADLPTAGKVRKRQKSLAGPPKFWGRKHKLQDRIFLAARSGGIGSIIPWFFSP